MEPNVPANNDDSAARDAAVAVLRDTIAVLRRALSRLLGEDSGDEYGLTGDENHPELSATERNLALHRLSGYIAGRLGSKSSSETPEDE
jgi:hypothetical protein